MQMLVKFSNRFLFSIQFKIDSFKSEDYKTMCGLLKTKYQVNN